MKRQLLRLLHQRASNRELKKLLWREVTPHVLHAHISHGMHGRWSGKYDIKVVTFTWPLQRLIRTVLIAVLYTTELRAPKLDEPAVRMLSWNVASLRSSLKKVQASVDPCRRMPFGGTPQGLEF